jgi:hypothetical protein
VAGRLLFWPPRMGAACFWLPDGSAVDLLGEATREPCHRVVRAGAKGQAGANRLPA